MKPQVYPIHYKALPAMARITGTPLRLWEQVGAQMHIQFYQQLWESMRQMKEDTIQGRMKMEAKNKAMYEDIARRQKNWLTRSWFSPPIPIPPKGTQDDQES